MFVTICPTHGYAQLALHHPSPIDIQFRLPNFRRLGLMQRYIFLREQLEFGFSVLDVSLCRRGPPCLRENGCWLFLRVSALSARETVVGCSLVPALQDCGSLRSLCPLCFSHATADSYRLLRRPVFPAFDHLARQLL